MQVVKKKKKTLAMNRTHCPTRLSRCTLAQPLIPPLTPWFIPPEPGPNPWPLALKASRLSGLRIRRLAETITSRRRRPVAIRCLWRIHYCALLRAIVLYCALLCSTFVYCALLCVMLFDFCRDVMSLVASTNLHNGLLYLAY